MEVTKGMLYEMVRDINGMLYDMTPATTEAEQIEKNMYKLTIWLNNYRLAKYFKQSTAEKEITPYYTKKEMYLYLKGFVHGLKHVMR